MDKEPLKKKLENALDKLNKEEEDFLISEDSNERSITHKFAIYLEKQFSDTDYDIDCEYNRMTTEEGKQISKRIYDNPDELVPVTDLNAKTVYPDIIIHNQENGDDNLLVIEAKKKNSNNRQKDYEKLNEYMKSKENKGLGYDYSAFVVFDTENPSKSYVEDVKDPGEYWG